VTGFNLAGRNTAFEVLAHLIPIAIGWIVFLIGSASLTALTDKVNCGKSGRLSVCMSSATHLTRFFAHHFGLSCELVKGLVIIPESLLPRAGSAAMLKRCHVVGADNYCWIFLTITLAFIGTMMFTARGGYGVHKASMYGK